MLLSLSECLLSILSEIVSNNFRPYTHPLPNGLRAVYRFDTGVSSVVLSLLQLRLFLTRNVNALYI